MPPDWSEFAVSAGFVLAIVVVLVFAAMDCLEELRARSARKRAFQLIDTHLALFDRWEAQLKSVEREGDGIRVVFPNIATAAEYHLRPDCSTRIETVVVYSVGVEGMWCMFVDDRLDKVVVCGEPYGSSRMPKESVDKVTALLERLREQAGVQAAA